MLTVVTGGSGSGKSAYAESLLDSQRGSKYYIATMRVYDEEGERKISRHRRLRDGKGFRTVEQPGNIGQAIKKMTDPDGLPCALLECMSNLVANEMFSGEPEDAKVFGQRETQAAQSLKSRENLAEKIASDVIALSHSLSELVVVTNNVFEDGIAYEESTMEYMRVLGEVNRRLCEAADRVVEVVVGIPVIIKGRFGEE